MHSVRFRRTANFWINEDSVPLSLIYLSFLGVFFWGGGLPRIIDEFEPETDYRISTKMHSRVSDYSKPNLLH